MKILEYSDLDISGVEPQYRKLIGMIEHDDFYSAETKKLTPSEYYRAKLDHSNRLLFTLRRHNGERYALILEVIRNHAYEHSRFLSTTRALTRTKSRTSTSSRSRSFWRPCGCRRAAK